MAASRRTQVIRSHGADILGCSFSGKILATCSADKLVRLWSIDGNGSSFSELPQSPLCAHSYAVNFCHFTPLGTMLATCSQDGRCILWDVRSGKKVCQFEHSSKASLRVCQFSHNGQLLATGCDDDTVCLWDVSCKRLIRSLEGHEASIVALAFSPDSHYLASGSTGGDLRIWDARYGHGRYLLHYKEAHDLGVTCCQFSPNVGADLGATTEPGRASMYILATGGNDNLVKLWRVIAEPNSTKEEIRLELYTNLEGQSMNIMALAFTPTGSILASACGDKSVVLWDPSKGNKLCQLDYHQRYVTCCSFSSDGKMLATGSGDRTVAIWRVQDEASTDEPLIELAEKEGQEPNEIPTKPVSDWTTDDVGIWLTSLLLPQYKDVFQMNAVDGQELMHINEKVLRVGLNIEALGHRNRIMRAVAALRDNHHAPISMTSLREVNLPDEYYCPITHELMSDPVIAADGYTYERSAIAAWLEAGRRASPMTNAPLRHIDLIPNRMLKILIQRNGQSHPQ